MARTILIVEDDDQLRDLLRIVLSDEGFAIQTCPDGQAAIQYLEGVKAQAKQGSGTYPVMILLDLNMPIVDGWKVAEWLHNDPDLNRIPVIVTSASKEHGEAAKSLHADAYLVKPFNTDEILGVVELFSLLS